MGAPILSVVAVYALREMYQYLLHSDVKWKLGWVGKWILISPAAHRLHHSIDTKDYNKNYSTFFIWWDKLLGTYAPPKKNIEIGIENNPYNKMGFFKGQWEGMRRFCGIRK
jgi:sterol desaturase/sphingolipid hydroxylase (fatty acid hydroxylase superfamily)